MSFENPRYPAIAGPWRYEKRELRCLRVREVVSPGFEEEKQRPIKSKS
jgi:hypothetical protein